MNFSILPWCLVVNPLVHYGCVSISGQFIPVVGSQFGWRVKMCACESVTRWPDNISRSTSSKCIYVEPHSLSGHGSMLGAFLFCRADSQSALAMVAPILKCIRALLTLHLFGW